ncbi:MAG: ABC transporter substrate-binding protein [Myxococcales bacterium]|nr:ABC transporter substrate-binding protein [Myxococcales bacterium]
MTKSRCLSLFFLFLCLSGCTKSMTEYNPDGSIKKIFHYFRSAAHKSLDPQKQFDSASADIINVVYDTLLSYHYLKRPYQLTPNLLTQMPSLSEDGLTYSFELRQDVFFMDDPCFEGGKGRQLTVDDVIYTLKRFADYNVNTISYGTLMQGYIKGMDVFRAETKKLGESKTDYAKLEIEGIKKTGQFEFEMTLTQPIPMALLPFAASQLAIVAREAVMHYGIDFKHHPVGSGPFYISQYSRRGEMRLAKNPKYHLTYPLEGDVGDAENGYLKDAGKRLPLIDEVRLPLIEESQPRMLKFRRGRLDWVGVDKENFTKMAIKEGDTFRLIPELAGSFRHYYAPYLYSGYWSFNMKDPVLGSECKPEQGDPSDPESECAKHQARTKALRQAMAYAFDMETYIDKMRNGRGLKSNTIVPIPIAGSEKDTGAKWYPFDLKKAKEKLVEAGYPGGEGLPPIKVEYAGTSSGSQQDGEFFRRAFAAIGIELQPQYQTFSAYLKKTDSGNFQLASSAWSADYPDAENFYQLLYGPNGPPGPNHGAYANPRYDALYLKSKYMSNGPERYQVFKEMADILKDEVPFLLTVSPISFGLYQNWLLNMKRHMMVDSPYQYINIDTEMKKKGLK